MKKRVISAACAALLLVFTACGAQSGQQATVEKLTGEADGFGGPVSVELTVTDGTITAAAITGDDETPEVGQAAFEELQNQIVAANGSEIDGVSGATITTAAVKTAVQRAMGVPVEEADTTSEESAMEAPAMAAPAEVVPVEGGIQIGQVITAAHGTKCFSQITAVVQGDVVIAAYIDEYQFGDPATMTCVPNADDTENFGAGFAEGQALYSKRVNAEVYSANMADHGNSTVPLDQNYDEIQKFAVGKTIDELIAYKGDAAAVDAVSGATLVDTGNYLAAIGEAGKVAQGTQGVEFSGSSEDLSLKMAIGAAHGNKCFSTAAALTDGTNILLSWIDEFQFGAAADVTPVPNSDDTENFGAGYADPANVLFSKRVNADYYSELMASHVNATVRLDENYNAIQNHVNGMSIADATALAGEGEAAVDAVSGATLADTAGYVGLIVEATK